MEPLVIAAVLASLVGAATLLGLAWRATTGRVRRSSGAVVDLAEVPAGAVTLLQFSTAVCAPCRPTHALLEGIAAEQPGVQHVDLDVGTRPELAERFNILQTPTTLILGPDGSIRARIGGAPRADEVRAEVAALLAA